MTLYEHLQNICRFRNWMLGNDTAGNITVDLRIPDGGSHRVTIIKRMDTYRTIVAVFIADVCHENEIRDPMDLLEDCGRMNHGSFAIWNDRLVVMDTQVEDTADIEEIAAIIYHLANYADSYQRKRTLFEKKPPAEIGKVMGGPRKTFGDDGLG